MEPEPVQREPVQGDSYPSWFIATLAVVAVLLVGMALYLWLRRVPSTTPDRAAASTPAAEAVARAAPLSTASPSSTADSATPVLATGKRAAAEPTSFPTPEAVTTPPTQVSTETEPIAETSATAPPIGAIDVVTPTLIPEATENTGTVEGQIALEGRSRYAGITLLVDGVPAGTTDAAGKFRLRVPAGHHQIQATYPGYVPVEAADLEVRAGEVITLPAVSLLSGDTDGNGTVDLLDIVRCAANIWQKVPPAVAYADVNGDGVIDMRELILTQRNYGISGPTPWQ